MQTIQEQAVNTYNNNLAFFSKHHPELYRKLTLLDLAVSRGQYREKYDLEYRDGGYFDVKERESNTYLYGQNSRELARKAAKGVNYKRSDHVIETFYKYNFEAGAAERFDQLDVCDHVFGATALIMDYANQVADHATTMKKIYKFVFFGVGLGQHLAEINRKIDADLYLVIEDDLELFKLSLFVTDYQALSGRGVWLFSVMEGAAAYQAVVNSFLSQAFIRNHYLKYHMLSPRYMPRIKQMQSAILAQSHLTYSFDRLLQKNIRTLDSLQKGYRFLNISEVFRGSVFSSKPVLFVAAGPSLKKHLAWLQQHHEKFIVVSVFTAYKTLEKAGVKPDVIIHIDEGEVPTTLLLEQFEGYAFDEDCTFVFAPSVSPRLLGRFDKNRIFMIEDRTAYKDNYGNLVASSVGEIGYAMTLLLGADTLYLLGLDLALDSETGESHSEDHIAPVRVDMEKSKQMEENVATLRETLIPVKGNHGGTVMTTPLFEMSIHQLNGLTQRVKGPDQHVYNLGEGAYFESLEPMLPEAVPVEEYVPVERSALRKEIEALLSSHATSALSERECEMLRHRLDEVHKIKRLIEVQAGRKFSNADQFTRSVKELIHDITDIDKAGHYHYGLKQVYIVYFYYVSDYIFGLFNTRELDNPKRHAKKMNRILTRQLAKIVEKYEKSLMPVIEGNEGKNEVAAG